MSPANAIEIRQLRIPGYEVLSPVGEGGMSTVYLARQMSLDRQVAIKVLSREFLDDADMIRRFQMEAETLARLDHPNIVSVVDRGMIRRHHYFVMEYVDGPSLKNLLHEEHLTVGLFVDMVEAVGKALSTAHDAGVVHRDVKPSNVLISKDNSAIKLSDFGIAAILRQRLQPHTGRSPAATPMPQELIDNESQMTIGTAMYMAPEQALDASTANARSDVFSFAIMIHEALTGDTPGHEAPLASRWNRLATRRTDAILARALEIEPERRTASAGELARDIIASLHPSWKRHRHEPIVDFRGDGEESSKWLMVTVVLLAVLMVTYAGYSLLTHENTPLRHFVEYFTAPTPVPTPTPVDPLSLLP